MEGKRRWFISALLCFFIIVNIFIIFMGLMNPANEFKNKLTGKGLFGAVGMVIERQGRYIEIHSPLNQSYSFALGTTNFTFSLNVSPTFSAGNWKYSLYDRKHNNTVYNNLSFTPNISFSAVRWSNYLVVYANEISDNELVNNKVTFFVYVPNSAPVISNLSNNIYICENSYLSSFFNATDVDENALSLSLNPLNPFYIREILFSGNHTEIEIYSGTLRKNQIGFYSENVSVSDGEYSDSRNINISVIEINNPLNVTYIGVQTVWLSGENLTFYRQVNVSDVENGNQNSGNFTFNLTFLNSEILFNITNMGIMNFTPNSSQLGVYNITVCARDKGISNIHPNISLCGQDGSSITSCFNFSLTVTSENRAPSFISHYPVSLTFSAGGEQNLFFNITKYDADGTIPDAYWYVDDVFRQYNSGMLIDNFTYAFPCGESGKRVAKVIITDGLLNASLQWNISLASSDCPALPPGGGGGGGGGGGALCTEKWACEEWGICNSLVKAGKSIKEFNAIKNFCWNSSYNETTCGFQTRKCQDLNRCNSNKSMPGLIRGCYYTEKPSCFDSIQNCHDGACEILADCGGPCAACPTCSDKIQNQGETGIDCGGPCPACEIEKPLIQKSQVWYIILIILLILLMIILIIMIIRLSRVIRIEREFRKKHSSEKF